VRVDIEQRAPGAHMESELGSQPDAWQQAIEVARRSRAFPAAGERVAVVGCGTSWFMAQSYARLREEAGHGETDAWAASEAPLDRAYDAVVAISRSGTTTEVLEHLAAIRGRVRTIGIVGDPESPLVDAVDDLVALPFADERSVVQTRFATSALAALRASLSEDLRSTVEAARAALREPLDPGLVAADQYTFLGHGWSVGIAHEAALKLRESSQSWTESYPALEYRHGPIAIAAPGRVVWSFGSAPGIEHDVRATGAHFESRSVDPLADLVRLHRVALERARRSGIDPDQPRNLSRSVILSS
jgi:fructoselysine-6-P-deglycase FrlB-like protein